MSVCSGLDQIEDFLLSSTVPISTGIGLGLGTSSTNTNRTFMGPPISSGNLNGLNLSLNHGLDLTCPTYGVMNLTQTASQQQSHNSRNDQILNLTQPLPLQSNHNSFNNRNNNRKESSEVGLNLSLQNGMNLTRQAYYYNEGDFDYNNQQQNTVSFESSTPHRSNDPSTVSANLMMPPHEAHRYSPLNLEHRSSPLNLTHARKYPDQNQYFNFSHQENYSNYNPSEMMSYSNEPARASDPLSSSTTSHTSSQNTNGYYYDQISTNFGTSNNYINSQLQNAKIRLFCSTCSQEFATSNELNKHMEKHNSQLENNVGSSINSAASVSNPYSNNTSVSSGTTSIIKQPSTSTSTSTTAGSYANVKSYSSEFQVQDHSSSNNTFDNVMNFSCDINKIPASSQPESMAVQAPPPPISEKIKAEMPAIVAPNNSTKKKSGDEPKSLCSECSLAFPTGQDLKKHIDLAHRGRQGGKKYQCPVCSEEFDDVSSHKQHMEFHIQEKPFKCHRCGLHLTKASGLKR